MADFVQVVGSNTGLDLGCHNVQNFSSQLAHFAHGILPRSIEQVELVPVLEALALRDTRLGVVGAYYGLGHGAPRGQRVHWPEGTGVREGGERVVYAGCWIRFRYDLRSYEVVKDTILRLALGCLMHRLVVVLCDGRALSALHRPQVGWNNGNGKAYEPSSF